MEPSRRSFLKSVGLGFVALGLPPTFLVRAAGAEQNGRGKVLVVVFQRGGTPYLGLPIRASPHGVPARRHGWVKCGRAV